MVLNLDCLRDTLHFINESLMIDEKTKETIPLRIADIYKADKLSQYSEADIYLSLCYLSDMNYIVLIFKTLNSKRLLFCVDAITIEGQHFYYSTLEPSTWEGLKNRAKTLDGYALKFIGDTVQKCAVTATATDATGITSKMIK